MSINPVRYTKEPSDMTRISNIPPNNFLRLANLRTRKIRKQRNMYKQLKFSNLSSINANTTITNSKMLHLSYNTVMENKLEKI